MSCLQKVSFLSFQIQKDHPNYLSCSSTTFGHQSESLWDWWISLGGTASTDSSLCSCHGGTYGSDLIVQITCFVVFQLFFFSPLRVEKRSPELLTKRQALRCSSDNMTREKRGKVRVMMLVDRPVLNLFKVFPSYFFYGKSSFFLRKNTSIILVGLLTIIQTHPFRVFVLAIEVVCHSSRLRIFSNFSLNTFLYLLAVSCPILLSFLEMGSAKRTFPQLVWCNN